MFRNYFDRELGKSPNYERILRACRRGRRIQPMLKAQKVVNKLHKEMIHEALSQGNKATQVY